MAETEGMDWLTLAQVILLALSTVAALATVWRGLQRDSETAKLGQEERHERKTERLKRSAVRAERRLEIISQRVVELWDAMSAYDELAVGVARMKLRAALAFTSEQLPVTRNLLDSARTPRGMGDLQPLELVRAAIAELQERAEKYEGHGLKLD